MQNKKQKNTLRKKSLGFCFFQFHEVKENNLNQEVIFLWCDMQVAARTIYFYCNHCMIFIVFTKFEKLQEYQDRL